MESAFQSAVNMASKILGGSFLGSIFNGNQHPTGTPMTPTTPTPTPTIPPIGLNSPVLLPQGVPIEQAMPYIQHFYNNYHAAGPPGWQSPLSSPENVRAMAQYAYQNNIHPGLMPLLAAAETQGLKPGTAGAVNLNPFNVFGPNGQLFNYNQPQYGLNYALERYPQNIAHNWTGSGWDAFRQNPTLQNFVKAQNPVDNSQGETNTILQIARQAWGGGVAQ